MSNDPRTFDPPVDATFTMKDGTTWTRRERNARHIRGDNAPLLKIKPLVRLMCETTTRDSHGVESVRRILFGVVFKEQDVAYLLVAQTGWNPDPLRHSVPLFSDDFAGMVGNCPCGRIHPIDFDALRRAVTSHVRVVRVGVSR